MNLLGKSDGSNREIALATLVELLVQFIFIFTLLLVISEAIEGSPIERGWVSPDAWRTLVNAFDVEHIRDTKQQADEIASRYKETIRERDALREQLRACQERFRGAEGRAALCERQLGRGPGLMACRSESGESLEVLRADVTKEGLIVVYLTPYGNELLNVAPLTRAVEGRTLTSAEFLTAFRPWRNRGVAESCAFTASLRFEREGSRASLNEARAAIVSYFRLRSTAAKND